MPLSLGVSDCEGVLLWLGERDRLEDVVAEAVDDADGEVV